MQNPIVLKSISILAFVISALFTIFLMTSGTVGIIAYVLTVGMAVILEACKCGFFYEALSNTKLIAPIRALLAIIAILLVGSSIFASASYVQNQANKTKNIQTKDSSQYKQLEQGKAVQQDLYNVKKKEIDDLKALQEKQQANGDSIVNSMPKNYIDRKNQAKADTASQIAKTQDIINSKSNELSGLGAFLQNPIDTTNLKLNSDSGYTAMFRSMAEMINSSSDYKSNPVKAESLEMWFFISLGVIFEMVAILTAYLAQLKGVSAVATTKKEIITDSGIGFKKPQLVTATAKDDNEIHAKRQIGFNIESVSYPKVESKNQNTSHYLNLESPIHYDTTEVQGTKEINQDDLKIYLDYMYQTAKNNISTGYMSISKNTELTVEGCRKIKGFLERHGVIETVGSRTVILKDNWSL